MRLSSLATLPNVLKQFQNSVYCSAATSDIVLRSATASERVHAEIHNGIKSDDYYTFRNLREPVLDARGKPTLKNGRKVKVEVLVSPSISAHLFGSLTSTAEMFESERKT